MVRPVLHRTGMRHPELGLYVTGWQPEDRCGMVNLEIGRHNANYCIIQVVQGDTLSNNPVIPSETSLPKPVAQHHHSVPRGRGIARNKSSAQEGRDTEYGKVIRGRQGRVKMFRAYDTGQINRRSEERRVGKECRSRWSP